MGRRPIGGVAMTAAERSRKCRARYTPGQRRAKNSKTAADMRIRRGRARVGDFDLVGRPAPAGFRLADFVAHPEPYASRAGPRGRRDEPQTASYRDDPTSGRPLTGSPAVPQVPTSGQPARRVGWHGGAILEGPSRAGRSPSLDPLGRAIRAAWAGAPRPLLGVLAAAGVYDRAPARRAALAAQIEARGYHWTLAAEWLLRAAQRLRPRSLGAYFAAVAEGRAGPAELARLGEPAGRRWVDAYQTLPQTRETAAAREAIAELVGGIAAAWKAPELPLGSALVRKHARSRNLDQRVNAPAAAG